jgi:hypothetical protein
MGKVISNDFSDRDISFLIETVDRRLLNKLEAIKGDSAFIESMLDAEVVKVFQRIMLMNDDSIIASITPRFLFDILLRVACRELENHAYTMERTASQKIPVFDTPEVVRFLSNKAIIRYLADMLTSFTRIESFTLPVRMRKGVWRRFRYNDMDLDSLLRFCQTVDEEHRFSYYKRIADICLFILGMFPEYAALDFHLPSADSTKTGLFGRFRRSAEDYEEEGRRFYKLAGEHSDARLFDLVEIFHQLQDKFNLAKKPLNYISENFLHFRREKLFPSAS